jgi:hypothetical protein
LPIRLGGGPPPLSPSTAQPKATVRRGKRKTAVNSSDGEGGAPSKQRKERDPKWNRTEMLALVRAKRTEFIEELEADNPWLLMNTKITKWKRISLSVSGRIVMWTITDGRTVGRWPQGRP